MVWALFYLIPTAYCLGWFNGSDGFRINPSMSELGWNVLAAIMWPLGIWMMLAPERWKQWLGR